MSKFPIIEEVFHRSEQGVLRPFKCRASDGQFYFVKGRGAGTENLLAEYFGARLGQLLGLPVPPFEILRVTPDLVRQALTPGIAELGPGLAYGSQIVENVLELSAATVGKVPVELQRLVLVFDWWIRNEDRTLSALGGNPNLLWQADRHVLAVIDHHAAFDPTFNRANFQMTHVFRQHLPQFEEPAFRELIHHHLDMVIGHFDQIVSELPDEWKEYMDDYPDVFDIDEIRRILNCYHEPDFWRRSE